MNDKELLEKAAKAAGIEALYWNDGNEPYSSGQGIIYGDNHIWNPLNSDGDALRLAVKLRIDVNHGVQIVAAEYPAKDIGCAEGYARDEGCAATRRAIVRAAAAIGETME